MTGPGTKRVETLGRALGRDEVASSVIQLVERYRPPTSVRMNARFVIELVNHGHYTIHVNGERCFVSVGAHAEPEATVTTDVATWLDLVSGRHDGIAAFSSGRLAASGDLNLALRLATLFGPGADATRLVRMTRTSARGTGIEALVAGSGQPVLLLHGLAASKVSFIPTVDGLADRYEVHALDLPGFGKSDKPLPTGGRYRPRWMATAISAYMRANGIRDAYVVGNSFGGRIAVELALREPRRVRGVVTLGAAVAFDEWQWAGPLLRRLHGQWLGIAPFPIRRAWVEAAILDLFSDPSAIPHPNLTAAVDEFLDNLRDHRHRLAIAACARHIACEKSDGRDAYWGRLERLATPSLWIWGRQDRLSSCRYAERVSAHAKHAEVEIWEQVGHVPQFEAPDRTNDAIISFIERTEAPYR